MDETATPRSGDLQSRLDEIEEEAPAVAPIVAAAVRDETAGTGAILETTDDPLAVVVDQRAAMVRAVELRDDESLPAEERARWAAAVEQLAEARHQAKHLLAERRREDPTEEAWSDATFQAEMRARMDDDDAEDLDARNAPPASGEHSGRDEPAPWQDANDRVGPASTPTNAEVTDQLTSGPGLAGGTGGAGSENYPADTGARRSMPPLAPDEDVEPPDIGHR